MDTNVSVEVPVDKKIPFNTKLRTPELLTVSRDKGIVITIEDTTPNDVRHTIPLAPQKNKK